MVVSFDGGRRGLESISIKFFFLFVGRSYGSISRSFWRNFRQRRCVNTHEASLHFLELDSQLAQYTNDVVTNDWKRFGRRSLNTEKAFEKESFGILDRRHAVRLSVVELVDDLPVAELGNDLVLNIIDCNVIKEPVVAASANKLVGILACHDIG